MLLELNDVCALEDAVDPHGCVEKNGGLHECAFFPWWRVVCLQCTTLTPLMSTRVDVWRLLACCCRPGPRVFVCVVLSLHGAFDAVEDACGAKWCARVGVVHVEVSSVGLFARSALRVCPGSNDDRVLGNRLAGALIYPVRVGDARLDGCGGFLGCVFVLTLRPFLVEGVYVLGAFNPFGDAR